MGTVGRSLGLGDRYLGLCAAWNGVNKINYSDLFCKMKFCNNFALLLIIALVLQANITKQAQYEDARCKCIPIYTLNIQHINIYNRYIHIEYSYAFCPNLNLVNPTHVPQSRKHYIGNVPPNKCNCDSVVLPKVAVKTKGKEQEFGCPQLECKYKSCNTTTIKVVVIFVIWAISLLVKMFLMCLDSRLNQRAIKSYQEHTNDEEEELHGGHVLLERLPSRNVLNHQYYIMLKKQESEQRCNIYNCHHMLKWSFLG